MEGWLTWFGIVDLEGGMLFLGFGLVVGCEDNYFQVEGVS